VYDVMLRNSGQLAAKYIQNITAARRITNLLMFKSHLLEQGLQLAMSSALTSFCTQQYEHRLFGDHATD
jgi:hypothetical protein